MKYFYLAVFVTLIACSSDDDPGGQGGGDDFFECKIDGQDYRITGDGAFASKIDDDLFVIYGNEALGQGGDLSVFVSLTSEPGTGTFDLKDSDVGLGTYLSLSGGAAYTSAVNGDGTLTVTEKSSTRIKGTFAYTAVNPDGLKKIITDGKFDVAIK